MNAYQTELTTKIITHIKTLISRVAFVKKDDKVIADSNSYGYTLPSTGVEGQIFFHIQQ